MLDETHLYINLNNNQNLTERDIIIIIDNKDLSEHQNSKTGDEMFRMEIWPN